MTRLKFTLPALSKRPSRDGHRTASVANETPAHDELMNPSKYAPENDRRSNYRNRHLGE